MNRRTVITSAATVGAITLAGCTDSQATVEDSDDGSDQSEGSEDTTNEDGGSSEEEQLIDKDPITDLLPSIEEFPGEGWKVEDVVLDPDSELRIDASGGYYREMDDGGEGVVINVTGYDTLDAAGDRYDASVSLAESRNQFERTIDSNVDQGYIGTYDGAKIRVWRDANIVFQVLATLRTEDSENEPLPELAEELQQVVRMNWQSMEG